MPGEVVTLGKKLESIPVKLHNEVVEIQDYSWGYNIKTGDGRTLLVNKDTDAIKNNKTDKMNFLGRVLHKLQTR